MAEEVISLSDDFYILSTSPRVDDRVHVLKHGDTFAIFDRFGDIERFGHGRLGVYHQDTRFLSRFTLWVEEDRPLLLSSSIKDDNAILTVDLMNPDFLLADKVVIPRGTVHIFRSKVLWEAILHERIRVHNYGMLPVELDFVIEFDANFADIFEVRGIDRKQRGCRLATSQMVAPAALTTLRSETPGREQHCHMTRLPNTQLMHLSTHETGRPGSSLRTSNSTTG